ncbi:MAG: GNAT family N-acetyltransferase [Phycisphaerae bacterium]|nr:GNAT family N-acetyltransferase [Phycisphaerae bacterium]
MGVKIAEMAAGDLAEVLALWEATENLGLDEDIDTPDALARYLARNPGLSFVAREEGMLVGAVLCGTDGRRGYLNHLAVASSRRRQGIGRRLVDASLAALSGMGIARCHTFVYVKNVGGLAFWESQGWRSWVEMDVAGLARDTQ